MCRRSAIRVGVEMKCTKCDGTGRIFAHVHTRDPKTHGFQYIGCFHCDGTGKISKQQAELIEVGEELRKDRQRRGLTLRQEAERLGISIVELSERERGVFIKKT